jgi:hypothetical protein
VPARVLGRLRRAQRLHHAASFRPPSSATPPRAISFFGA